MKVILNKKEIPVEEYVIVELEKRSYGVMVVAKDHNGNRIANIIAIRHDGRLQLPQNRILFTTPVDDTIETW